MDNYTIQKSQRKPLTFGCLSVMAAVVSMGVNIGTMAGLNAYNKSKMPPKPESYTQYTAAKNTLASLKEDQDMGLLEKRLERNPYKNLAVEGYIASRKNNNVLREAVASVSADVAAFERDQEIVNYARAEAELESSFARNSLAGLGAGVGIIVIGYTADIYLNRRRRKFDASQCDACQPQTHT